MNQITTNTTESDLRAAAESVRNVLEKIDALLAAVGKTDTTIASSEAEIEKLKIEAIEDADAAQKLSGATIRLGLLRTKKASLETQMPPLVRTS